MAKTTTRIQAVEREVLISSIVRCSGTGAGSSAILTNPQSECDLHHTFVALFFSTVVAVMGELLP
jgi:hypothetical protein